MSVVNRFNVNNTPVTLDADIIENMSANDVSYESSIQYDENTVGGKLSELENKTLLHHYVASSTPNEELVANLFYVKKGQIVQITLSNNKPSYGLTLSVLNGLEVVQTKTYYDTFVNREIVIESDGTLSLTVSNQNTNVTDIDILLLNEAFENKQNIDTLLQNSHIVFDLSNGQRGYYSENGKTLIPLDSVRSLVIDVAPNERIRFIGSYYGYMSLYHFENELGLCFGSITSESGEIKSFDGIIDVPERVRKMYVSVMANKPYLLEKIPAISLPTICSSKDSLDVRMSLDNYIIGKGYVNGILSDAGNLVYQTIQVSQGERYRIVGGVYAVLNLYILEDANGNIVEEFRGIGWGDLTPTDYDLYVDIPENVVKLHCSSIINRNHIVYRYPPVFDSLNINLKHILKDGYYGHGGTNFNALNISSCCVISVNEGEKYRIKGKIYAYMGLYTIVTKHGGIVTHHVNPNYGDVEIHNTFDEIVEIPKNGAFLYFSSEKSTDFFIKKLPIYSNHYKEDNYCNRFLLGTTLCIGDSTTYGYNNKENDNYPSADKLIHNYPFYLGKLAEIETENAGRCAGGARIWWNEKIENYNYVDYSSVIINLGTNYGLTDTLEQDTSSGDFATYADTNTGKYCAIIEKIKADNPNIVIFLSYIQTRTGLVEPTETMQITSIDITNSVIKKIAQKYGLRILDDRFNFMADGCQSSDRVHFTGYGNLRRADEYLHQICDYIADYPEHFNPRT